LHRARIDSSGSFTAPPRRQRSPDKQRAKYSRRAEETATFRWAHDIIGLRQQRPTGRLSPAGLPVDRVAHSALELAGASRRLDPILPLNPLSASTARKAHREHRAFARLARHGHVAAHHARELAGDCEAKTRTSELLSGRGIGLAELLEQLCLLLRRHADAGVGDSELDEAAAIAHHARRKLNLARFGELAGIAQKIEQYLP
jgi:hypothetical protein